MFSFLRLLVCISASFGVVLLSLSLYFIGIQVKHFNVELSKFNETFVTVSKKIPLMISVVSESNESIDSLNSSIKFIDGKYHSELLAFNAEVSGINKILPSLIDESVHLRQEIPLVVKEIRNLLVKAQDFSLVASEGVVKGFLRGFLSLPAEVLSSVVTLPFQTVQKVGQKVSVSVTSTSDDPKNK